MLQSPRIYRQVLMPGCRWDLHAAQNKILVQGKYVNEQRIGCVMCGVAQGDACH